MDQKDLFDDALRMSVNKNLVDVTTLLQWAHESRTVAEKRRHVEQAVKLLQDVAMQLTDLEEKPVVF